MHGLWIYMCVKRTLDTAVLLQVLVCMCIYLVELSVDFLGLITIGSNCPGISGTVPEIQLCLMVPQCPTCSLLFVPEMKNWTVIIISMYDDHNLPITARSTM